MSHPGNFPIGFSSAIPWRRLMPLGLETAAIATRAYARRRQRAKSRREMFAVETSAMPLGMHGGRRRPAVRGVVRLLRECDRLILKSYKMAVPMLEMTA